MKQLNKNKNRVISENRKARFNYTIEDIYEAGIQLLGTEVKSIRDGRANLKDSYAIIKNGEVFINQMHIGAYPFAAYGNHDPLRVRKLLLHKYEIKKLYGKINEMGLSLIPLKMYFKNGKVKLSLAIAKGKRRYDKRESIKHRDEKRDMERALRGHSKVN